VTVNPISLTTYTTQARSTKGFSLVELMVALAISIVLIGAVVLTYISSTAAARDAETLARMQENVRIVSEYLVRDVRNAGFRDETTLKVGHERSLRQAFASIDGDELMIRYSGLGHCGQTFDTPRIVQNRYFVEDSVLVCEGRYLPPSADQDSTAFIQDPGDQNAELVGGVTRVSFSGVCAGGDRACGCGFNLDDLASACIGVEMRLTLEPPGGDERDLVLLAAFRNVILERINQRVSK